jgi:hypothetical protein
MSRSVCRVTTCLVASQMTAQSRQSVMLLMSCVTSGSARESSAHAVQVCAHAMHASMHAITKVSSASWTCLRALRSSIRRTSCSVLCVVAIVAAPE